MEEEGSPHRQSQQDEDVEGSHSMLPPCRKKAIVSSFVSYVICGVAILMCVEVIIVSKFLLPLGVETEIASMTVEMWPAGARSNSFRRAEVHFRPSFHLQSPNNWMHGAMFYKGFYHLFYQYNQWGAMWGNFTWGHAVSTDLIHWLDLEPPLKYDQLHDVGGLWFGSVTFRPDGTPIILYKCVPEDLEETQNMAVPADTSDPYLRKWVKISEDPLRRHPDIRVYQENISDPSTAWLVEDGSWRMTVGTDGMALDNKSNDLVHSEVEKNVFHTTVRRSGMWKCLDFYPVASMGQRGLDASTREPSVKHVLVMSSNDDQHDYYDVGFYKRATKVFTPINQELNGLQYDLGNFDASKSFYDPMKKRRIVWGWSNEADTEAQYVAKGWASLKAIPRTVWRDSELGDNLIQAPIEELKSLRGTKVSKTDVELEAGSTIRMEGSSGGQLDVEVTFEYPAVFNSSFDDGRYPNDPFDCSKGGAAQRGIFGPFGLLVMADEALQEQTAVFFYISQSKDRQWATHVCSDQSRSSLLDGVDRTAYYWGNVRVLPSEDFLSLRILVDHSIVESFVQGGRMAITSRVYPTQAVKEQAHVFLFNNGNTRITVRKIDIWQMDDIHAPMNQDSHLGYIAPS